MNRFLQRFGGAISRHHSEFHAKSGNQRRTFTIANFRGFGMIRNNRTTLMWVPSLAITDTVPHFFINMAVDSAACRKRIDVTHYSASSARSMTSLSPPQRESFSPHPFSRRALVIVVALWMVVVIGGFAQVWHYEGQPGTTMAETAAGPDTFPATDLLTRNPRGQTLLMFVHPHCACSRASLGELAAILRECPDLQPVQLVLPVPVGATPEWQDGKIARDAAALSGVRIFWDQDEKLTRQFQATTSGHVLLFAADGKRLFSGGITALRGHAGWNAGRGAIVALHKNQPGVRNSTPVFGCQLSSRTLVGDSRP